jgi:glutathione S-transferase
VKLLYGPLSPFVRKVMITLHELRLLDDVEIVPFPPLMPTKPHAELIAYNPLGKIPALVLDEGDVLFDSPVICEYLDDRAGGGRIFPAPGIARWRSLTLNALADGILDAGVQVRLEMGVRAPDMRNKEWMHGHMTKVRDALADMAQRIDPASDRFTIGEIAAASALGWLDFRLPDEDWRANHPELARWYAGIAERPSLKATVPK